MSSNGAGELQDGDGPDRKKIKTSECVRLVIYTTNYCFTNTPNSVVATKIQFIYFNVYPRCFQISICEKRS